MAPFLPLVPGLNPSPSLANAGTPGARNGSELEVASLTSIEALGIALAAAFVGFSLGYVFIVRKKQNRDNDPSLENIGNNDLDNPETGGEVCEMSLNDPLEDLEVLSAGSSEASGFRSHGETIDPTEYDAKGRCVRHPHVRLRKKKILGGGWRVLLGECPRCCLDELVDRAENQDVGRGIRPSCLSQETRELIAVNDGQGDKLIKILATIKEDAKEEEEEEQEPLRALVSVTNHGISAEELLSAYDEWDNAYVHYVLNNPTGASK